MRCLLSEQLSRSVIPKEVQAASLSPAGSVCVGQASLPSFLLFWDFWVGSGQDWCGKSHGDGASEVFFFLQGIHSPPGMGLPQFPWDVLVLGKGTAWRFHLWTFHFNQVVLRDLLFGCFGFYFCGVAGAIEDNSGYDVYKPLSAVIFSIYLTPVCEADFVSQD